MKLIIFLDEEGYYNGFETSEAVDAVIHSYDGVAIENAEANGDEVKRDEAGNDYIEMPA